MESIKIKLAWGIKAVQRRLFGLPQERERDVKEFTEKWKRESLSGAFFSFLQYYAVDERARAKFDQSLMAYQYHLTEEELNHMLRQMNAIKLSGESEVEILTKSYSLIDVEYLKISEEEAALSEQGEIIPESAKSQAKAPDSIIQTEVARGLESRRLIRATPM